MDRPWAYPVIGGLAAFLVSASGDLVAMGTVAWRSNAVVAFAIALAVNHQIRVNRGRI
ncbi:hypothetical protein [Haloarcula nitratireducens]|uniref:Uncharacterized protein n=1 Tax=Haloarcula nitratireducens TaxID=2487749 RepID=A0AAW4PEX6_9EURY|nr:hypothetical protein [Halomicroarcula nitratireducens]MBX0295812.1 hypothetical protein [Halomicroarcula nitratireducens]